MQYLKYNIIYEKYIDEKNGFPDEQSAESALTICLPMKTDTQKEQENMVVDMELEAAKTAVFELMKEKENIETELRISNDVLATVSCNRIQ